MLNTYIKINDRQIIAGQTSSGIWYCKELPCNTVKEMNKLIGETNEVLNKYNKPIKETKKEKEPPVKGLK